MNMDYAGAVILYIQPLPLLGEGVAAGWGWLFCKVVVDCCVPRCARSRNDDQELLRNAFFMLDPGSSTG
jgi:hypothetical protein